MPQTLEAQAFLERIVTLPLGPGVLLDAVLQPSLDDESSLRKLFATDRTHARLGNPYVGLVDVFDAPQSIKTTRARLVKDEEDLIAKHVMPLTDTARHKEGEPCLVSTMDEFKVNWSVFTEGSLSQLPLGENGWANVVAAGGSVLACLAPLPDNAKVSKRAMRKWYHNEKFPTSDVDLFLYGMTPEQAEVKINEIYEAVRDGVPWDVTCIRTKHTVSIHSQYPYRSIQIVLRLYASPAEILAGFDVDAPCVAYDGHKVWASPRAIVASMRQANTVDITRRSPSYEIRLAKYASRGYEIYVPTLRRKEIDPTIYERAIARITGLARLLVLEKLADPETRLAFMESRRALRGRPNPVHSRRRKNNKKYKGDLKADLTASGLEMNDYDVTSLHIPYGPGWDARRIDKLVYQTDLGMNSTFNPKNKDRRLHRHPAFFGTMKECLEDCCEHCPEPIDEDEKKLEKEESETYIKGRIAFIEDDPGRQSMTGSFNPIDDGEWSEQTYVGATEKFFAAIAINDRALVQATILEQAALDVLAMSEFEARAKAMAEAEASSEAPALPEGQAAEGLQKPPSIKQAFINRRDHVGRTALHLAVMCKHEGIAADLIDAGARITARLVDGRTALHIAAQLDLVDVVQKLVSKSKQNEEDAIRSGKLKPNEEKDDDVNMGDEEGERVRASSEDDWSSDENDVEMSEPEEDDEDDEDEVKRSDGAGHGSAQADQEDNPVVEVANDADISEEEDDLDIIDIDAPDWDLAFTPLHYASLFATLPVIDALIAGGADVQLVTKANSYDASPLQALTMTLLRTEDPEIAATVAERLLTAGATSSGAYQNLHTIFMWAVEMNQVKLVDSLLRCDKNAKKVIDFPWMSWNTIVFPLVAALCRGHYGMVAVLLAHGAKLSYSEEEVWKIKASLGPQLKSAGSYLYQATSLMPQLFLPIETAVSDYDDIYQPLAILGADINAWLKNRTSHGNQTPKTMLDWIRSAKQTVDEQLAKLRLLPPTQENVEATSCEDFKSQFACYIDPIQDRNTGAVKRSAEETENDIQALSEIDDYLAEAERFLISRGGKTGAELQPPDQPSDTPQTHQINQDDQDECKFARLSQTYPYFHPVPPHEVVRYHGLFDACYKGNDAKIVQLCLPAKGSETEEPLLQVASVIYRDTSLWRQNHYSPLFAAVLGRRWRTAKLIMAIAAAQYKSENEDEPKFDASNIHLDSDDSGSDDSDDSDMTVDQRAFTFVDIASRPSAVECNVHPKDLLLHRIEWIGVARGREDAQTVRTGTMLAKAIEEGDMEGFINIANLYKSLPEPLELEPSLLSLILLYDEPDILDEFIKRTGYGIDIELETKADQSDAQGINDQDRIYLGLNVHGKKRADLARHNDPNAQNNPMRSSVPLLWQAALVGAKKVFEYLCSNRPFASYTIYAVSNNHERALKLRRAKNLETVLPGWLGWKIDVVGESPLTAAVFGKSLDIVKLIFKKSPKLASASLKTRLKFVHWDVLTIAVYQQNKRDMIDFLLANGLSPLDPENVKSRNILHFCCRNGGNTELVAHLLDTLPRDTIDTLLLQQTQDGLNTPLHLAVASANAKIVEMILGFLKKSGLLLRNKSGETPLHMAVMRGLSQITKFIIAATDPEVLSLENGVGETPFETAMLQETIRRSRTSFTEHRPRELNMGSLPSSLKPFIVSEKAQAINELRSAVEYLILTASLHPDAEIAKVLSAFASRMETKVSTAKSSEPKDKQDESGPQDTVDRKLTLEYVQAAQAKHEGPRRLVHLRDVQAVVRSDLPRFGAKPAKRIEANIRDDDVLDEGVEEEDNWRSSSVVLVRVYASMDDSW